MLRLTVDKPAMARVVTQVDKALVQGYDGAADLIAHWLMIGELQVNPPDSQPARMYSHPEIYFNNNSAL